MGHKPGDLVVHQVHGVGHVVAIEEMDFSGKNHSLFYRVGFDKTTIWIQVQNDRGIRAVTARADLPRYRNVLESPPVALNPNFHLRQKELENRLQNRSFGILCEVVRDLNALKRVKVLNNYERDLFRRTIGSLQQEWAISSGVRLDESSRLIDDMLEKSRWK
jgi:RNA polymerase-interacting CarD/CdnL/TRCF family regulator